MTGELLLDDRYLIASGHRVCERRARAELSRTAANAADTRRMRAARLRFEGAGL